MTENSKQITELIFDALDELDLGASGQKIEVSKETILFGEGGLLASIQLVNFIVSVEQKIEEAFGKTVSIADEKAISQRNSPFRTVGTFCDYVIPLLA